MLYKRRSSLPNGTRKTFYRPRETFAPLKQPQVPKNTRHVNVGIWDIYQDIDSSGDIFANLPDKSSLSKVLKTLPYVWRFTKEISGIGVIPLSIYILYTVSSSVIPTLTLYYSNKLLNLIQTAAERKDVDMGAILFVAIAHTGCIVADHISRVFMTRYRPLIYRRVDDIFLDRILDAQIRLDLATFGEATVQSRLKSALPDGVAVASQAFEKAMSTVSYIMRIAATISILVGIIRSHQYGLRISVLCLIRPIMTWVFVRRYDWWNAACIIICQDTDFFAMEGLLRIAQEVEYRKEIIAYNLQSYILRRYRGIRNRLGDQRIPMKEAQKIALSAEAIDFRSLLPNAIIDAPRVLFALSIMQTPISVPVSIMSLKNIEDYTIDFVRILEFFAADVKALVLYFGRIRDLYELSNIQNKVVDGAERYPCPKHQATELEGGMSIEFKNVTFRYPTTDKAVLRHASFQIHPGQLCVVVGANGEGKSTIMKLLTRMYDCTEGSILVDGQDIRDLHLEDLRKSISVLFQDYVHFPLSIAENIAMGDPSNKLDMERVAEAARLSGAADFIENLPEQMDTIIDPSIRLYTQGPPDQVESLLDRIQHPQKARSIMNMNTSLSGGQMQRLALSRTFMRRNEDIKLCLYDEPSAALDPDAEYDLFKKLRDHRGKKTMIFSSHRFGHLTKYADIILFIKGGSIMESGTHTELLALNGHYARLYKVQAQAFEA